MADSRIPAAIDALVAAWTTALAADDTAAVYDGPVPTGDEFQRHVYVGWSGDPEGDNGAVSGDQEWRGVGKGARRELFNVACCVMAWDPAADGKPSAVRDDIYALFNTVETALRADPSLGLPPPCVAEIRNPALFYRFDGHLGVEARISFEVSVDTRI